MLPFKKKEKAYFPEITEGLKERSSQGSNKENKKCNFSAVKWFRSLRGGRGKAISKNDYSIIKGNEYFDLNEYNRIDDEKKLIEKNVKLLKRGLIALGKLEGGSPKQHVDLVGFVDKRAKAIIEILSESSADISKDVLSKLWQDKSFTSEGRVIKNLLLSQTSETVRLSKQLMSSIPKGEQRRIVVDIWTALKRSKQKKAVGKRLLDSDLWESLISVMTEIEIKDFFRNSNMNGKKNLMKSDAFWKQEDSTTQAAITIKGLLLPQTDKTIAFSKQLMAKIPKNKQKEVVPKIWKAAQQDEQQRKAVLAGLLYSNLRDVFIAGMTTEEVKEILKMKGDGKNKLMESPAFWKIKDAEKLVHEKLLIILRDGSLRELQKFTSYIPKDKLEKLWDAYYEDIYTAAKTANKVNETFLKILGSAFKTVIDSTFKEIFWKKKEVWLLAAIQLKALIYENDIKTSKRFIQEIPEQYRREIQTILARTDNSKDYSKYFPKMKKRKRKQ